MSTFIKKITHYVALCLAISATLNAGGIRFVSPQSSIKITSEQTSDCIFIPQERSLITEIDELGIIHDKRQVPQCVWDQFERMHIPGFFHVKNPKAIFYALNGDELMSVTDTNQYSVWDNVHGWTKKAPIKLLSMSQTGPGIKIVSEKKLTQSDLSQDQQKIRAQLTGSKGFYVPDRETIFVPNKQQPSTANQRSPSPSRIQFVSPEDLLRQGISPVTKGGPSSSRIQLVSSKDLGQQGTGIKIVSEQPNQRNSSPSRIQLISQQDLSQEEMRNKLSSSRGSSNSPTAYIPGSSGPNIQQQQKPRIMFVS